MGRSIDFLGIRVDDITAHEVLEDVKRTLATNGKMTISQLSPNTFNLLAKHPELQKHLNSMSVVCPDSAGVIFGARLLGESLSYRVPGDVLAPDLYRMAIEKNLSVYLLGGKPGVATKAAERLREAYPGLHICGVAHGYFSPEEDERIVQEISDLKADIILIGMGVPRQEAWIFQHSERVSAPVLLGVGGYFDHVLNRVDCYPAWVFKFRMVWIYRLLRHPGTLWKRYLLGNPLFLLNVLKGRLGLWRKPNSHRYGDQNV
jgi:N-acetylglucosaminyldiphosphoundecaprenol N-acetyl-beta-D-mannosaminyltransferase